MRKRKSIGILIGAIALMLSVACSDQKTLYAHHVDFREGVWNEQDTVSFSFTIAEAEKPYNISLFLRNDNRYPYQNIYYSVELSEGKNRETITYQLQLSDREGRWLGHGHGGLFLVDIEYKKQHFFPTAGTYTVRINQQMRDSKLIGIQNIGILVEKYSSSQ